ncbi:hypothetical protein EG327_001923 [Venturia inaequalis]|uniref:Uncharacterized protein n=1 Tax=Venturia inaequalis TaxID=5025 RepID=A0A8H3VH50_VENIN|nr:hypothetical protein EG327_001923 [Venturia inaequalis]
MNNLESSFGQLNMGLQNQGTQNNGPAVDGLDELTNQMNGFSIRQPQKAGDVIYDIQILDKLSRYICQNHRTNRWSNIPATTVEEQELRAREFQEKRAYEELEEGFEEVYGDTFSMILSIIRQGPYMEETYNGWADSSKRRAWLNFARKCDFSP